MCVNWVEKGLANLVGNYSLSLEPPTPVVAWYGVIIITIFIYVKVII